METTSDISLEQLEATVRGLRGQRGITRQVFGSELFGEDGAALGLPRLPIL